MVSTLIAIIVSFHCSLAEAVLLSLNSVKIETDKQKGLKYAIILDKLRGNISKPIAAILILNTVAHTGGATVAGSAFYNLYGDDKIWLFSTVFTALVLPALKTRHWRACAAEPVGHQALAAGHRENRHRLII